MSYLKEYRYKVILTESFKVIHKCPKCGQKTLFINTHCFRINANGSRLDVWLIYHCEKCKHTKNLTLLERVAPHQIPPQKYKQFLTNDYSLAEAFGKRKSFFQRNKVEISRKDLSYELKSCMQEDIDLYLASKEGVSFVVEDEYGLDIRIENILATLLGYSNSKVRGLMKKGMITASKDIGSHKEVTYTYAIQSLE